MDLAHYICLNCTRRAYSWVELSWVRVCRTELNNLPQQIRHSTITVWERKKFKVKSDWPEVKDCILMLRAGNSCALPSGRHKNRIKFLIFFKRKNKIDKILFLVLFIDKFWSTRRLYSTRHTHTPLLAYFQLIFSCFLAFFFFWFVTFKDLKWRLKIKNVGFSVGLRSRWWRRQTKGSTETRRVPRSHCSAFLREWR